MARIEMAPEILDDFDRILEFQEQHGDSNAADRIMEIVHAMDVLGHSPLIGRPVSKGKRELVVGRKARGFLVLYRYVEEVDTVFVLAVRSQREASYARTT